MGVILSEGSWESSGQRASTVPHAHGSEIGTNGRSLNAGCVEISPATRTIPHQAEPSAIADS